jgi:hypothetical protein
LGIPDEVPNKIMRAFKAPSYKAIAIAILKNDYAMNMLGYDCKETELSLSLMNKEAKMKEDKRIKVKRNTFQFLTYNDLKTTIDYPIISEDEKLLVFIPCLKGQKPKKSYYKVIKTDKDYSEDLNTFDVDLYKNCSASIKVE